MRFVPELGSRALFPKLEAKAYLNHAGISPASMATLAAYIDLANDYQRAGSGAYLAWAARRAELKKKLAKLIGAEEDELALMPNTTRGVIDVALSLPWKRGDRAILFFGEFPANVTPWQRAAELFGLEITMLPASDYLESDEPGLARLTKELERGARLVAVSAVAFQTGVRMPLAEMSRLAHAAGAELFVDGVQCVGAVPIDVEAEGVDYLACGSHKWLMGAEGAGFLYVRRGKLDALRVPVAGWLSHQDGLSFLFEGADRLRYDRPLKKTTDVFEGANVSAPSFAALEASVDLLLALGVDAIHAHVTRYLDAIEPAALELGFRSTRRRDARGRSAMLSLLPPKGASVIELQRGLAERGVVAATPDGHLRLSPHWPNELAEIPNVLDELQRAAAPFQRV
jgi:cysteine desulfurase / selenocysteine lyase